jgi:predicted nuclease of predicted toxin-antitoxin system
LVFLENAPHCGLIRLPDVPAKERLRLIEDLLTRFFTELEESAIITVRGGRVRISRSP